MSKREIVTAWIVAVGICLQIVGVAVALSVRESEEDRRCLDAGGRPTLIGCVDVAIFR
jgi:hypothetical protein